MFNKYMVRNRTGPSHLSAKVEVNENRAPTDESVRLLNEMEEKAKKNLMNKIVVDDNDLKGKLFIFQDHLHSGYTLHTVFTLNGKEYEGTKQIQSYKMSIQDAREEIIEAMQQAIFEALLHTIEVK